MAEGISTRRDPVIENLSGQSHPGEIIFIDIIRNCFLADLTDREIHHENFAHAAQWGHIYLPFPYP